MLNAPTNIKVGNTLLAIIGMNSNSVTVVPTGWQLITKSAAAPGMAIYGKIATGSEPATYTFTTSGAFNVPGMVLNFSPGGAPLLPNAGPTSTGNPSTIPGTFTPGWAAATSLVLDIWVNVTGTSSGASITTNNNTAVIIASVFNANGSIVVASFQSKATSNFTPDTLTFTAFVGNAIAEAIGIFG